MKAIRKPADVERVQYWEGQLLRGADLRTQRTSENELRWWHNRGVHAAYGVVDGLEVKAKANGYVVAPGFAYDGYGRELIVPCPVHVPPPCKTRGNPPPTWTLLLAYDNTVDATSCWTDDLRGACLPAGRCPGNDSICFYWVPRSVESDCAGVPLAHLKANRLDPSFAPPAVRPAAQSYVVTGQTAPGYTVWEEWPGSKNVPLGFLTTVDTSAAGFVDTPCYFAWLSGPRLWQSQQPAQPAHPHPPIHTHWWLPFDEITDECATSFTFRVPVLRDFTSGLDIVTLGNFLTFVRCHDIHICWIGVEHRPRHRYHWCEECCDERH